MSDVRWERIKDLLHQAMQLDPDQRARFLDDTCPPSDSCRAEVDSLLAADEDARSSFLQGSTPMSGFELALDVGLSPGDLFEGRFRLIEPLGEGGMGQVWLAEQTVPVRRQVALKLIKAGMYDQSVMQRFRSERQSLAMMDHPTIAKVFEAGATAQGQPYFVMEYVPGEPITQYCDGRRLGIRARVELVIQACEGVQHAHQKAIVHRDLKPANILVVELDGKAVPRIIDFGLAKAIAPQAPGEGEGDFTLLGQFVGTPGYMSPEQVDPNVKDIDTRTDVYSLGVVLYVLLCGRRPFDADTGRRPPLDELLRKLREEDPPPPSASVAGADDLKAEAAAARGVEPKQLVHSLRGDLDSIATKALERSRARRYDTASELAADLKRYLTDEPVIARPAGAAYRLKKYARRHRVAVGIAAGLMLLLGAFSILQGFELHRTEQERDRANLERDRASRERDRAGRERDRATRITDFMTNMFRVSDPSEARGSSVTAREILDKASTEMTSGLAHDADAQSQMLYVMASTYLNLGLYARAHELAERALRARETLYGARDPSTLESMAQLGWILDRQGRLPEADRLERQALESLRELQGPQSPLALESGDHLGVIEEEQGHYAEAERLAREVMDGAGRTLGPESRLALLSANHVAQVLWDQGRYADAEQQYRRLVDVDARVLGSDHPQTLAARLNLALAIASQQRAAEAEVLYRDVLSVQERVLGPEHQYTVLTMESLAILLINAGRLAEGERLHRRVLAIRLRTLGAEHPDTLNSQLNLADVLLKEDHVADADKLQRSTLAVQQRVLGAQNPETLFSESNLAAILVREHRYGEAEKLAAETLAVQRRALGQAHPETLTTLRILGRAMAYDHRYAEASRLLREDIEQLNEAADQQARASAWYAFASVALAAGRPDEAVLYLKEAVRGGYRDVDGLEADEDLRDLRRNPGFLDLVRALKGRNFMSP
jgi:eukaryotic-like serine/threonine-protein kinase